MLSADVTNQADSPDKPRKGYLCSVLPRSGSAVEGGRGGMTIGARADAEPELRTRTVNVALCMPRLCSGICFRMRTVIPYRLDSTTLLNLGDTEFSH